MTTAQENRKALSHYLDVKKMEAAIYGATPLPQALEISLIRELGKASPASLEDMIKPYKVELDYAFGGTYD